MPLSVDAYCPNELLRGVRLAKGAQGQGTYNDLTQFFRDNDLSPSTLIPTTPQAETLYYDPVLKALVKILADAIDAAVRALEIEGRKITHMQGNAIQDVVKFHLASQASAPEHAAVCEELKAVLLGTEAKGTGLLEAMPQCLQICADAALALKARGLKTHECVVPGIICAGGLMQVVGVGLMEHSYPYMVALSRPLSFMDERSRAELAGCVLVLDTVVAQMLLYIYSSSRRECAAY